MINPLHKFTDYVVKTILTRYNVDKIDDNTKREIIQILKEYGQNAEEIEEGLNKIRENSKIRREFSANVSHELKSPLTSIIGYAELISSGMVEGEQIKDFSKRINEEGNRLLDIINETIELSKIDNNHIKQDSLVKFDIGKVILDNIELHSIQAKEKNMSIHYDYKKLEFFGNLRLINDIVGNLISNAIKYSSKNMPTLFIKAIDKNSYIILKFIDNGIGISKEDKDRVFERFYIADKSRGKKIGTGLGLSLVKNIVEFHNGRITLLSELGKGSTFAIKMPKNKIKGTI